ncbi:unnamed protein product [Owenia fusiformis]|uniref:Uncharacterized protein n=1 Tax=Owenia fusiformis TaxID=6347 RepID=A0A8J1U0W0_OWEFU|nr:unnamed protein product [Owenia fusiformis]
MQRKPLHSADMNGKKDSTQNSEKPSEGKMDKMIYVVFFGLLIDLLAFTMILPLLPSLLDYYGQDGKDGLYNSLKDSVHGFRQLVGAPDIPRWNSVLFGGILGSMFSLLQFVTSPVYGAASDVYGRKPVLLLNMLGIALSYALWAISNNFTMFVIARIVGGISKGNVSLSTAVVTDVSTRKTRGRGMAMVGIAFSIGFLIGPLIGAYFAKRVREQEELFFLGPALFALTLAIIDIVFIAVCFKETLPAEKRASSMASSVQEVSYLINPVSLFNFSAVQTNTPQDLKAMRQIGGVYFAYLLLYSGLEFTLTFLTHNTFNYDSMQQGKMFFFIGIIMAVVQGGYIRRLKPGTEKKIAVRGFVLLIPAFILIGYASSTAILYTGLALFSFASATVVPCLTTLISSYGTEDQKGVILGIFRSLGALARAIGPMVASTIYWSVGPFICYTVGGLLLALPLIFLLKIKIKTT